MKHIFISFCVFTSVFASANSTPTDPLNYDLALRKKIVAEVHGQLSKNKKFQDVIKNDSGDPMVKGFLMRVPKDIPKATLEGDSLRFANGETFQLAGVQPLHFVLKGVGKPAKVSYCLSREGVWECMLKVEEGARSGAAYLAYQTLKLKIFSDEATKINQNFDEMALLKQKQEEEKPKSKKK